MGHFTLNRQRRTEIQTSLQQAGALDCSQLPGTAAAPAPGPKTEATVIDLGNCVGTRKAGSWHVSALRKADLENTGPLQSLGSSQVAEPRQQNLPRAGRPEAHGGPCPLRYRRAPQQGRARGSREELGVEDNRLCRSTSWLSANVFTGSHIDSHDKYAVVKESHEEAVENWNSAEGVPAVELVQA